MSHTIRCEGCGDQFPAGDALVDGDLTFDICKGCQRDVAH